MDLLFGLMILAVFGVAFAVAVRRANELFRLKVRSGRAELVRGRIPQRLLDDINDVVRRPSVEDALVRVMREQGLPRLLTQGTLTEAQVQQLRNVVGMYDIAKIKAGGRKR